MSLVYQIYRLILKYFQFPLQSPLQISSLASFGSVWLHFMMCWAFFGSGHLATLLGKCSEDSLPSNYDSLYQHILRVNFASYICKNCIIPILNAPSPVGYGWSIVGDTLEITWGTQGSAPDSILEFVSCKCKKGCQTKRCSCHKANLKCTELCQCSSCENSEIDEEEPIDNDLMKRQWIAMMMMMMMNLCSF